LFSYNSWQSVRYSREDELICLSGCSMSTSAFVTPTQAFRVGSMKRILGLVKPYSLNSISSSVAFVRREFFFGTRSRILSFDWYEDDLSVPNGPGGLGFGKAGPGLLQFLKI